MKQAFIEASWTPYGLTPQHNRQSSAVGFKKLGYDVRLFSRDDLLRHSNFHKGLFHASMEIQKILWEQLDFKNTDLPYHPKELKSLIGREVQDTTVKEAKKFVEAGQSLFIKPHWTNRKAFAGNVLNSLGVGILNEPNDTKVTIDFPCSFSSEWRLFIFNKKIVGAQFYKGDFSIMPPVQKIQWTFKSTENLPIAYCSDFGLNDDFDWQLIECNDIMFANPYGLYPELYAKMIEARWEEISS